MLHHRRRPLVAALALALLALPAAMLGAEEEDPAFTTIINVPPDEAPGAIDSNTQLNLFEGGSIPSYFDAGKPDGSSVNVEVNISGGSVGERFRVFSGSTVNISGGSVGDRFIATGSTVDISGGSVGEFFVANSGSTVNISGGSVGRRFFASSDSTVSISGGSVGGVVARSGSTVNVSGGTVGDNFVASSDSTVSISGGSVGHGFGAFSGSTVNLSGGSVGYGFEARSGSTINLSGGQFMLDGVGISQLPYGGLPYSYGKLFTGTLADGSVFIFATEADDRLDSGTTTLAPVTLSPADTTPMVVESGVGPNGLRPDQTLTLRGEGKLADHFAAVDATLHIEGGQVGEGLEVAYSQVDISGGSVGDDFTAFSGSTVDISGGNVGNFFRAYSGSQVSISGGSVGDVFDADSGSTVNLSGGQFMLDGAGISQLPAGGLPDGGLFTGTLADGSVFIFTTQADDHLEYGTTTLVPVTLSPADTTPIVVESGVGPNGLRPGQTLSLRGEGELADHFAAVDATLHIEGGQVGEGLEVAYSQVDISGGSVGDGLDAFSGSTVNISGGSVGNGFDAASGSTVNISGGSVGAWFDAFSGSTVNLSGGTVGDEFDAFSGSTVNISGGQFMLDGAGISQLPSGGLPDGGLFTGTLADGSVFIFAAEALDRLDSGTTTLVPVTLGPADTTPMVVGSGVGPNGLRPGQTLTLRGEGELADYFAAVDATLHIEGGQVGDRLEVAYSQVNIYGGSVGAWFDAFPGSTVNLSGGSVGKHFDANSGSTVNISGGSVGDGFDAFSGSTLNLFGLHFVMDGLDITDTLTPREPMQISHGEVTLGGLLTDGSRFSLGVASDAMLTITLDAIYGDANLDQVVDVIDLGVLGLGIGGEGDWRSGDFNHDDVVDVIDLGILGLHFGASRGGGTGEVGVVTPEPGGLGLLGIGALAVLGRGRRRRSE